MFDRVEESFHHFVKILLKNYSFLRHLFLVKYVKTEKME